MRPDADVLRDLLQVERRMRHNQLIGQILPDRQLEYWVGFDQVDESVVRLLLTTGVAVETTSGMDELRGTRRFVLEAESGRKPLEEISPF